MWPEDGDVSGLVNWLWPHLFIPVDFEIQSRAKDTLVSHKCRSHFSAAGGETFQLKQPYTPIMMVSFLKSGR